MEPRRQNALELFRAAVSPREERIDVVEAALLIAQGEYKHLDRAVYHQRLGEMGGEAGRKLHGNTLDRIEQLNELLFDHWGFHGNVKDYYDPRNSFLNDVLDRRTGIPLSLSLVYIEVGRRAGLNLVGIGMPGHFLVGCTDLEDLFVDAFSNGNLLTRAECVAKLRELQPGIPFLPEFLTPAGPRQILTRMLSNLLGIYLKTLRHPKALDILEMLFCVDPDEPLWFRRRALARYHLKNYAGAISDLESYLALLPDAPDREEVVQQLTALQHLRGSVN